MPTPTTEEIERFKAEMILADGNPISCEGAITGYGVGDIVVLPSWTKDKDICPLCGCGMAWTSAEKVFIAR